MVLDDGYIMLATVPTFMVAKRNSVPTVNLTGLIHAASPDSLLKLTVPLHHPIFFIESYLLQLWMHQVQCFLGLQPLWLAGYYYTVFWT